MTKVLLIGNGAREHAIAKALVRSDVELVAHMERKNPGITRLAKDYTIGSITDRRKLPDLMGIDYAFIGPEAPLAKGIVDVLESSRVPCIGPKQEPAKIETSKSFARRIIEKAAPEANPEFEIAKSLDAMRAFEDRVGVENIVVKPDGLTGGKGVKVFGDHLQSRKEVESYAIDLLSKHGIVLLEEKLMGTEFTVQAFVDGSNIAPMPLVRDYKRAFDDDKGPNTGSMGSYSREDHGLSFVSDSDLETALTIMKESVQEVKNTTKIDYKGILYGQFIKSEKGIKVIEFNARFGDPEAMNVLTLLETPIDDICQSIIDGTLKAPKFERMATVCVYVVPEGYPGKHVVKDYPITISEMTDSEVYFASVYEEGDKVFTTGSRSVGIVAKGDTIEQARERVYTDVSKVAGKVRWRCDIASSE